MNNNDTMGTTANTTANTTPLQVKIVSLCTGAGGLDIGIARGLQQTAGDVAIDVQTVLCCESDATIQQTIRLHNQDVPIHGDVLALRAVDVLARIDRKPGDIVLVTGGVPCPTFSTAGNRAGVDDPRGQCMGKFFDLATSVGADYIVLENVRGLLSAKLKFDWAGSVLSSFVTFLEAMGYRVSYQLYDTKHFGVPQSRDRVVLVATRSAEPVPFLKPTHGLDGLPPVMRLRDAVAHLEGSDMDGASYPPAKRACFGMLQAGQNWRGLPPALQPAAMGAGTFAAPGGKTGVLRRLSYDKPCPTLMCSPTQNTTAFCHPAEVRPLTVEEYAAIQTFPAGFELAGSTASKYRQLGNAVPVLFAEVIGRALGDHLLGRSGDDAFAHVQCSRYSAKGYATGKQ